MNPEILSVGSILMGVFIAAAVFIWQTSSQSNRLESKIDTLGDRVETQGKELRVAIETQGKELRAEIETQGKELGADMETHGKRVGNAELEQARLNGVNSVLMNHIHTHQSEAD